MAVYYSRLQVNIDSQYKHLYKEFTYHVRVYKNSSLKEMLSFSPVILPFCAFDKNWRTIDIKIENASEQTRIYYDIYHNGVRIHYDIRGKRLGLPYAKDPEKNITRFTIKTTNANTKSGTGKTQQQKITQPKYNLILGFEVNYPKACADIGITYTQNLAADVGHAFFYLTKDNKVISFFSFGPTTEGLLGNFTGKPATTSYSIKEVSKLFKIAIDKNQIDRIKEEINKINEKIKTGKLEYHPAPHNDTCAAIAKGVLDDAKIDTPKASGNAMLPGGLALLPLTLPYPWYMRCKKQYSKSYTLIKGHSKDSGVKTDGIGLYTPWILKAGDIDPTTLKDCQK